MPITRYFVERLTAYNDAWMIRFDNAEYETRRGHRVMSVDDPQRTFGSQFCCDAIRASQICACCKRRGICVGYVLLIARP